jgi:hypothetical protein
MSDRRRILEHRIEIVSASLASGHWPAVDGLTDRELSTRDRSKLGLLLELDRAELERDARRAEEHSARHPAGPSYTGPS